MKLHVSNLRRGLVGLAATGMLSATALAVPYATCLTNDGGTVWFRLNEPATNVKIIWNGGANTNDLGALDAGLQSTNLSVTGPFQVQVFNVGGLGYLNGVFKQIGSDANPLMRFVNQRGVAVNKNPASPHFGRVYVSVSQLGTNTAVNRVLGDGLYVLNADQTDALGQGDTALTGGLDWGNPPPNAEGPHRLFVGPDDNLYIGDWSDSNGSLYVTDANVANGQNVFDGPTGSGFPVGSASGRLHGSISAAHVEGSLAGGNLVVYVVDEDLQTDKDSTTQNQRNSTWLWNIGAGPLPSAGPPVRFESSGITFASQLCDLARGPDGKWYKTNRRAEPSVPANSTANIFVLSADGSTVLWNSLTASRTLLNTTTNTDLLNETAAVDVTPDGKTLAVLRRDTNSVSILPLEDGIPNLTNRLIITNLPTTGVARDLGFDAAGNLYAVSSGQGLLRILAPGGTTTATTGSDGTFQLIRPSEVSVVATDPDGAETADPNPPDTITFTLTRNGSLTDPLVVVYTLTGTASNGADYDTDPLTITFPANAASVDVVITPTDDSVAELVETVVLTVVGTGDYSLGAPSQATAYIVDNDTPTLVLMVVDASMYEGLPTDNVTFAITRYGDTNIDVFNCELLLSGTATPDADYVAPPAGIYIANGVVTTTVTITNLDDHLYEGNETILVSLGTGSGEYDIGSPGSVTLTIVENEWPPSRVLFADDLNADSSANWTTRFGAINGVLDATTTWAVDYATLGVPAAPHSADGSTRGLFVTVNKNDPDTNAAGINFYPLNQTFSGDYALRFDLYMSYGASAQTEHALAGLNHSGTRTNWASQSPLNHISTAGSDGLWFAMNATGGNLRDYTAYTSTNPATVPALLVDRSAATATTLLTAPPYGYAGCPGNASNSTTKAWVDVELSQVGNVLTLKLNRNTFVQVTNTYGFNAGNVMIGYNDQYSSIGPIFNHALFDNVQVVSLNLEVTSVTLLPGNLVQIDFLSPTGGDASSFTVQGRESFGTGAWTDETGATITLLGSAGWRAVVPQTTPTRFFRIRR